MNPNAQTRHIPTPEYTPEPSPLPQHQSDKTRIPAPAQNETREAPEHEVADKWSDAARLAGSGAAGLPGARACGRLVLVSEAPETASAPATPPLGVKPNPITYPDGGAWWAASPNASPRGPARLGHPSPEPALQWHRRHHTDDGAPLAPAAAAALGQLAGRLQTRSLPGSATTSPRRTIMSRAGDWPPRAAAAAADLDDDAFAAVLAAALAPRRPQSAAPPVVPAAWDQLGPSGWSASGAPSPARSPPPQMSASIAEASPYLAGSFLSQRLVGQTHALDEQRSLWIDEGPGPAALAAGEAVATTYATPTRPYEALVHATRSAGRSPMSPLPVHSRATSLGEYLGRSATQGAFPTLPGEPTAIDLEPRSDHVAGAERRRGTGHVKFFHPVRGYGFVVPTPPFEDPDDEIFVHYTVIHAPSQPFRSLLEGSTVEYECARGPKGWFATRVTGVGGVEAPLPPMPARLREQPRRGSHSSLGSQEHDMDAPKAADEAQAPALVLRRIQHVIDGLSQIMEQLPPEVVHTALANSWHASSMRQVAALGLPRARPPPLPAPATLLGSPPAGYALSGMLPFAYSPAASAAGPPPSHPYPAAVHPPPAAAPPHDVLPPIYALYPSVDPAAVEAPFQAAQHPLTISNIAQHARARLQHGALAEVHDQPEPPSLAGVVRGQRPPPGRHATSANWREGRASSAPEASRRRPTDRPGTATLAQRVRMASRRPGDA